ncbi:DUF1361 domain-containing protein [Paenibacillus agilis]|uniref:DUF1361 domain-containing protein n=1 Tax=Paenibacillus agilis TaxID=3020863 RepID=A0A559IWA3_9BACL|nr:DUF1361 domain-containing protein [Paenibacillus agilis]TVX91918.1 DUF1361 domain-containing protein [Paenibacillus agilis]
MNIRSKARLGFFLYIGMLLYFDTAYSFMIFNLFLAFAALELSYLMPLFKIKTKREIPISFLFYLIFILMSPNVFYVVTDLIHLKRFDFNYRQGIIVMEWWNFFVLVSGVLLAICFYILMTDQVRRLLQSFQLRASTVTFGMFVFLLLTSFGIFIGRFLRFHSIHLFTEPWSLIERVWYSLDRNALLFILWMTILQAIIVWMFGRNEKRGEE